MPNGNSSVKRLSTPGGQAVGKRARHKQSRNGAGSSNGPALLARPERTWFVALFALAVGTLVSRLDIPYWLGLSSAIVAAAVVVAWSVLSRYPRILWLFLATYAAATMVILWQHLPQAPVPLQIREVQVFPGAMAGQPAVANFYLAVDADAVDVQIASQVGIGRPKKIRKVGGGTVDVDVVGEVFWQELVRDWSDANYASSRRFAKGQQAYFTRGSPPLTQSDVEALESGDAVIFAMARLKYGDGPYDIVEHCSLFVTGRQYLCKDHNGPVRR